MKKLIKIGMTSLVLASCAGPQQEQAAGPRTIEPTTVSSHRAGGGEEGNGEFVLSRKSAKSGPTAEEQAAIHLADDWWKFRGEFLRMNVSQAKERDQEIS